MSRFIHRVKEAMGTAKPTEDSEATRESKDSLRNIKGASDKIIKSSSKMAQDCSKLGESGTRVGNAFIEFGKVQPEEDAFAEVLIRFGELELALDNLHLALGSQITETMAAAMKQFAEIELKLPGEMKAKQEEARMSFDIVAAKNKEIQKKQGEKWQEKKDESEAATNLAKGQWEMLSEEFVDVMADVDRRAKIAMGVCIMNYMRALDHHFTTGSRMLQDMAPLYGRIEQTVEAMRSGQPNVPNYGAQPQQQQQLPQQPMQPQLYPQLDEAPPYSTSEGRPPSYATDDPYYGAPPPGAGGGYGTPPPGGDGGYGAPPPGGDGGYGAPPPGGDGGSYGAPNDQRQLEQEQELQRLRMEQTQLRAQLYEPAVHGAPPPRPQSKKLPTPPGQMSPGYEVPPFNPETYQQAPSPEQYQQSSPSLGRYERPQE